MELTLKEILEQVDIRGLNPEDRFRLELMGNDDDIHVIGTGEFDKIDRFVCLGQCVVSFDGESYLFPSLPVGHPYASVVANSIYKASPTDECISGVWIVIMDNHTFDEVMKAPSSEPVDAGVSVFIFFYGQR